MQADISVTKVIPQSQLTPIKRIGFKLLDKALGIAQLDKLYRQHKMKGLDREAFAKRLLEILDVDLKGVERLQQQIPKQGPVVIASNHPFGGLEGVILALVIGQVRPDIKVLVNEGLRVFPELADYFIFTNPLSERNPKNGPSLRRCRQHVDNGGALLLFPAGRVSYYRKDKKRISDHDWNRIVGRLIQSAKASFVPVFVDGHNSAWFYRVGRIHDSLRIFMLARELTNKQGSTIHLHSGHAVPASAFDKQSDSAGLTSFCKALSYAQSPSWLVPWRPDKVVNFAPLAEELSGEELTAQLAQLPPEQKLLDFKHFSVYFGYQQQMPAIVNEIARLRERVFREHNEGSGEPIDTDGFDATYTQLFMVDNQAQRIIGAYRMGRTDELQQQSGIEGLYLSRMFKFGAGFLNQQNPCLELGRSFVIPEYQRSVYGLFLLWRGIGAFVSRFPKYRYLYGTVSLSKLYDPRTVALIGQALIKPNDAVAAHTPFALELHPEMADFSASHNLRKQISAFTQGLEQDGKDIPVLLKHYMKLGAQFHCLGLDSNFNDTPGLLLSVDLVQLPEKLGKQYMAEGWQGYLSQHQ